MELDNNVDKDEKLVAELFGIAEKIEIDNSNNNDDYSGEFDNIISYEEYIEYIEYERKKAKTKFEPPPKNEAGGSVEAGTFTKAAEQPAKVISKALDNNNIQQKSDKINNKTKIDDLDLLYDGDSGDIVKNVEEQNVILGFLLDGGVNFLIGKGGIGKTYLSYHLAVALLELGYEVIYIDVDNPSSIIKKRKFEDKILEMNMRNNIRYYNFINVNNAIKNKKVKSLEQYIRKLMDNIADYKQLYPNKKIVVFFDALQGLIRDFSQEKISSDFMYRLRYYSELGLTYIILHHTTKSTDNIQFRGYGVLRDAADMMYFIQEVHRDDTNAIVDYVLKSEKSRWDTSDQITIKLKGSYECDIVQNGILGFENTVLKLCYFALKGGKKLMKNELVEEVQKKVKFAVGKAKISDVIDELKRRKYLLSEKGDRKTIYFTIDEDNDDLKKLLDF